MDKIRIGIRRLYDYPSDVFRQTPGRSGQWGDVEFLIDQDIESCDVLVVLNLLKEEIEVECSEVWLVIQEPPLAQFPWIFEGHEHYDRVFAPTCGSKGTKCVLSHGALPWHVEMSYDELSVLYPPEKARMLSWVTTNKTIFPGHEHRMCFLRRLTDSGVPLDLYGYGFNPIPNKYDALAPYRYSLAVENFAGPHYWTEKVADCFLSWTMPIYYGCTNLADYFPQESFVRLDINDKHATDHVREIVQSDRFEKNLDAIAEARHRVLEEYQLFPFLASRLGKGMKPRERRILKPFQQGFRSRISGLLRSGTSPFRRMVKSA